MRMIKTAITMVGMAAFGLSQSAVGETVKLRVVGQPLSTGLIQKNKEEVFFKNLAKETGMPFEVDYKPVDTLGIKDTEQLRVLKTGLFDIVSLRVLRNSRDEPALVGLDLVGAGPDFGTARKVFDAYSPVIDRLLQKKFNSRLLGAWPFGAQILFCKKPITGIESLKGLKVRVIDQNLSKVMETLGATPVPMSFPEVHQALALGAIDCGVTDPSSANSAGWPEVTTHQLALGFQMSPNAYVITQKAWERMSGEQQKGLEKAFAKLNDEIWQYSEMLHEDALLCNTGSSDCKYGKKFNLQNVPVKPEDVKAVQGMVKTVSVPAWAEVCDKVNPGCSDEWLKLVGPIIEGK